MFKQSPSRSNRSKGSKVKLILQICLLLAVCFWLIYQVKRSHDKKAELDSKDEKVVGKVQSDVEILRFGRKDLPRITETAIDVDEHLLEEEEENNHEDDKSDREDDDIDENETEHEDGINKSRKEAEKTESAHEDNERDENEDDVEDDERSETEEHDGSTKDDVGEGEGHDVGDMKLEEQGHEAREEQYKADDASSEVHDNQTIMPETGNVQENETITSSKEDEVSINITSTNATTVTEFNNPQNDSVTMVGNISEQTNNSHSQLVSDSNNTETVDTKEVESLISDDTNTMLAEGQKSEDSGTLDSDENVNVIPHDPIDASDSTLTQDETDLRMDLDALPGITSEAQNTDDTMAAE